MYNFFFFFLKSETRNLVLPALYKIKSDPDTIQNKCPASTYKSKSVMLYAFFK